MATPGGMEESGSVQGGALDPWRPVSGDRQAEAARAAECWGQPRPQAKIAPRRPQFVVDYLRQVVEREVVAELVAHHLLPPRVSSAAIESASAARSASVRTRRAVPASSHAAPLQAPRVFESGDIVAFATHLLDGNREAALAVVDRRDQGGATGRADAEAIALELLAGAARHFGTLWEQDEASIVDVTDATSALEEIFRALGIDDPTRRAAPQAACGSAILAAVPGEQHSFGLSVLAAFFRRAGWAVRTPHLATAADAAGHVSKRAFDMLGFSLGAEAHLDTLRACVATVRRRAFNRDILIMVGGPIFIARPELALEIGADATAPDAAAAVDEAGRRLRARSGDARAASGA